MPAPSPYSLPVRRLAASWRRAFGREAPELLVLAEPGFDLESGLFCEDVRRSSAGGVVAVCGQCQGVRVLLVSGHPLWGRHGQMGRQLLPVAAASAWGIRRTVYLGIGLALREDLKPGTWCLATDYLNLSGVSPFSMAGVAFPVAGIDPAGVFDAEMSADMTNAVALMGVRLRLGVYQFHLGPQYPSPAETRLGQTAGADLVGFGMVPEALAAVAGGGRFMALLLCLGSLLGRHRRPLSLSEMEAEAGYLSPQAARMLANLVRHLCWGENIPAEALQRLLAPPETAVKRERSGHGGPAISKPKEP